MYEITCMAAPHGLSSFGTRVPYDLTHDGKLLIGDFLTLASPPTPDPYPFNEILLSL